MKRLVSFFLLCCLGCTSSTKKHTVHISLINNNNSLKFTGIDAAILGAIQRDSLPGIWQTLIPVYRMPDDTNMKDYQPPQPGTYQVENNVIVFTPDTAFIKGKLFFVRYFHFGEGGSAWDMIKHQHKLGSQPYTDLAFKVTK